MLKRKSSLLKYYVTALYRAILPHKMIQKIQTYLDITQKGRKVVLLYFLKIIFITVFNLFFRKYFCKPLKTFVNPSMQQQICTKYFIL